MSSRLESAVRRFANTDRGGFSGGLIASLAVAAGYVPIAISFGLLAVQSGLPPINAVLVSALIFAGASQFVLLSLLAGGAGMFSALFTIFLINARHIFYGPTLSRKLPRHLARIPRAWLAVGLTDEVFATSLARLDQIPEHQREAWYLGLELGAYTAWVGGTVLGVASGERFAHLPAVAQHAIQFVLPALFMALLLDLASRDALIVVLIAGATTLLALQLLPAYQAILIGMVAGALTTSLGRSRYA